MKQTPQQRKPRYRRVSVPVRLQDRDADIIKLLYKYRFLSSEHIRALVDGSEQNILRRLQKLYHAGYLDRPPEQIRPYRQGSDPMVYGLGNRGADLLEQDFGVPRSKVDWTSKNREVKTVFLEHTLMVSNFLVCLALACRRHDGVELIEQERIIERRKAQAPSNNPLGWMVQAIRQFSGKEHRFDFSIVPDGVFGLHFPKAESGRRYAFFFLEADRSTMPIKSDNLRRSSYFKKLIGYWESYRQSLFEQTFGFKHARVLTITKSDARIDSMIGANKDVDERRLGSKMFYFAPARLLTVATADKLFDPVWRNGHDERVMSLLD